MSEEQIVPKTFSEQDKKLALQNAIYRLVEQQPFYGSLLQEINIRYNQLVPTAGITFNEKLSQFEVYINPDFFLNLTNEERLAVFHHEILHFTNKHLFRLPFMDAAVSNEDKKLFNIAGDMAINQYIKNLPVGCVDFKEWKLDNGATFPALRNMEQYHELIKKEAEKQKQSEEGKGKPDKNGKPGEGTSGNVNQKLEQFKDFDQHFWDSLDEETKKKMLDEAKKIIKRTVEKTSYNHSNVPDSIKDLLVEIDGMEANINYKQILRNTIKKTVSAIERQNTWKKPNKRYGNYSPGSKLGETPKINFYNDSSGSISIKEQNTYMQIMGKFLEAGSKDCILALWHTSMYYKKKYKLNAPIPEDVFESGGTDVQCVINDIEKTRPNLSIILTDLYFDAPVIKGDNQIIFIVSEGGNKNHGFKLPNNCKIIFLENLK